MNHEQDKRNAAFFYSVHLLKMLLKTALITGQEYERIKKCSITERRRKRNESH